MRKHSAKSKEKGVSGLLYIFFAVIIVGVLGIAFDGALGNYTANSIRDILNESTLAASNQTAYSGNTRVISSAAAKTKFKAEYSSLRTAYPNVTSQGNYTLNKFTVSNIKRNGKSSSTLTVKVTEHSKTFFMSIIGQKQLTISPTAVARLGSLYELK